MNGQGHLSYLPGQRLSRCTCPGESHPGPVHEDGEYVGRSGPEIDVFEAQVSTLFFARVARYTQDKPRLIKIHSSAVYPSLRSGRSVHKFLLPSSA